VPERSPREINGVPFSLMALSAATMSLPPLMPAGSLFCPIRVKSLYITGVALYAEPIGDEFFLGCLGVDKHNVGVPPTTGIGCLPGSPCGALHIAAGLGFEQGEYVAEQARVLRRGR